MRIPALGCRCAGNGSRVSRWHTSNRIMKRDVTALLKEALALPATERAALAEALVASLEQHSDEAVEAAWKIEIERRISELDAGVVSMIPLSQVRHRLFDRARRRALKRPEAARDAAEELRDGLDLGWMPASSRQDLHRR
jgi:putative addiction module component (TIGR02574 family)